MKLPYIYRLIKQGEHQQQDFKFEISDAKKIARTFVAFSNSNGGKLLIGVKDNGKIAGIRSEEEKYMAQAAATMYCFPEVKYTSKEWLIEGKKVLEIDIPEGPDKPYYALNEEDKKTVYIRVNDENILANNIMIRAWKRKNRPEGVYIKYTQNERLLLTHLEKQGSITLEDFRNSAGFKF
jgi:predicted HTH transcriptional regulator